MKMKNVIIVVIGILLFIGCGGTREETEEVTKTYRETDPVFSEEQMERLVNGNSEFAMNMFREIRNDDGNVFYSPYSISIAMSMVYAGAEGVTDREISNAMCYKMPENDIHSTMNALELYISAHDDESTNINLNIANSLWGDENMDLKDEYVDRLTLYYGSKLRLIDLYTDEDGDASRLIINEWVEEQTENKITDLIPEGAIDWDTKLILVNAIYFYGKWENTFSADDTMKKSFNLMGDETVEVDMMSIEEDFGYFSNDKFQAVELPYEDERFAMLVVMPYANQYSNAVASFTAESFSLLLEKLESKSMYLELPKFEMEFSLKLKDVLMNLGISDLFYEDANLSGITEDEILMLDEIYHKTYLKVDELGTEAAAATAGVMKATMATIAEVDMIVDSPFIFFIYDNFSESILFMGEILDPTS